MKNILLVFLLFFICFRTFANVQLDTYDIKSYSPIKKGLIDLYFEVRSKKLKGMVEISTGVKLKEEIYFKVYWRYPVKTLIDVEGLPPGYKSLKQNLTRIVSEVLDYVVPRSPKEVLKIFKFGKAKKDKNLTVIRGTTDNPNSAISEVLLYFNNKSLPAKMVTLTPYSKNKTTFNFIRSKHSDNKYLTDSLTTVIISGKNKSKITKTFSYIESTGYLFPGEVSVEITQESLESSKPSKSNKSNKSNKSIISISNYKVNKGIASKRIFSEKKKSKK